MSKTTTRTSSESKLAFTSSEAIKKMADGIISDKKNTNNLVKLTEFLEELFPLSSQKHRKLALQTISSLVDVFSHFFEEGTLILTVTESKNQKDAVACDVSKEKSIQKKEYMKWIYEQYVSFTKYLPLYAVHYFTKFNENYEEIETVIKAILDLSKKELTSASGSTLVEMERERNRINTIINEGPFGSFIYHLIYDPNNSEGKEFVITCLKEYIFKFHDLRFFAYISLTNAIRKIRSKKKRMLTYPQLYDNVLQIIDGIPIIDVIGRFYLYDGYDYDSDEVNSDEEDGMDEDGPNEDGIPDDFMMDPELGDLSSLTLPSSQKKSTEEKKESEEKDEEMKDEDKENNLLDPDVHINAYTNFWLAFLQIPEMTRSVYEKVLRKMSTEIIPQFEDPFLLNDFISNSFDQGGLVALLSVKSLFILITEYNL
ncbi:predicted protein [Naegleria gruberi]|uniref:Predicted protein n=1 Tax=Naegleria gruberi TaxID=5762 RepID=D2V9U2_NAEGR|nr:uncharacterized protein NAEGRDRAFT_47806 [Naegleria gruberi]EFC46199.1 predicted protein [Naegleria gruberi]|eukprot:XP_002678943.1 predicted protein [Naegleria gruberi strain NEG-M]